MKGHIILILATVVAIQGQGNHKFGMDTNSKNMLQRLKLLHFQNIDLIRKYVKRHSIWDNSGKIVLKNNIAVVCRERTMRTKMSVKERANELLNIMGLMVTLLQQLQVDESRFSVGAGDLTSDLRSLELGVREFAESVYRKVVENSLGFMSAPYTIGSFPGTPIYNGYSKKTVRTMIVMQLYAIQSCIGDVYHVLKKDLFYVLHPEMKKMSTKHLS